MTLRSINYFNVKCWEHQISKVTLQSAKMAVTPNTISSFFTEVLCIIVCSDKNSTTPNNDLEEGIKGRYLNALQALRSKLKVSHNSKLI